MMRAFFAALALSLAGLNACAAIAQPVVAAPPVTAAEWKAMLTAAKPGSTIELGDRAVQFVRMPAADVTIHGGHFRDVTLDKWRNVTFEGSTFEIADNQGQLQFLVIAYAPENVTFRNCDFRGTDLNGTLQVKSLSIRDGHNVTVQGSRFYQLANFIGFTNTDGVLFEGNDVALVREGIQIAGAQHVTIRANRFGPFRPAPGDHPDAIQFFTAGLKQAARDVLIEKNLFVAGPGGRAQGVLVGDEAGLTSTGAGYARITVRDNELVGTGWHGISVGPMVDDLVIERNTLLRVDGADLVKDNWIKALNGRVENNTAPTFTLGPDVQQAGNVKNAAATPDQQASAIAAWNAVFRAPPAPPGPTRAELMLQIDAALKAASDALVKLENTGG